MKYWYIKHKKLGPIRMIANGGFTIGEWDGWLQKITDVTIFPKKSLAKDAIKLVRNFKTIEEQKKFILVKVTRKSK